MKSFFIQRSAGPFALWLVLIPLLLSAGPMTVNAQPPPVSPQLVREGDFAVMLLNALGMGQVDDEAEAESRLGDAGITPRNGWIADYPTTPDILGEIQASVAEASLARRIGIGRDDALARVAGIAYDSGLSVIPYSGEGPTAGGLASAESYPSPAAIGGFYYEEGPPVYTYYTPPPDFYYLYVYVPYPFWGRGLWFPGFFVLHDFHKVFLRNGRVVHCSNHFNDRQAHRVFRVDPLKRFRGSTYAGIGAPRSGKYLATGVPRSDLAVFNAIRPKMLAPKIDPSLWGKGAPSPQGQPGNAPRGTSPGGGRR
ncbi:MAG TPA: hypothetical protein VGJ94_04870 [Syntrophorhabdaceae bacterium]